MKQFPWSRSKANLIVNILLLAALGTLAFCAAHYIIKNSKFSTASLSADGKVLIEGIDPYTSGQTILLFLDKNCHFCKQDSPFYRRLAETSQARNVQLVIAFQHNLEDGINYLKNENIPASKVIQIRLKTLDIQGTPTLMLLNRGGKITAKWAGELSRQFEDYIVSIVGREEESILAEGSPYLTIGRQKDPPLKDSASLRDELRLSTAMLIDIDDRKEFAAKHIAGAVNIPEDELYSRALNELSQSKTVVLFTRGLDTQRVRNAETALRSLGFNRVEWLKLMLEEASSAGFDLVTDSTITFRNADSARSEAQ